MPILAKIEDLGTLGWSMVIGIHSFALSNVEWDHAVIHWGLRTGADLGKCMVHRK